MNSIDSLNTAFGMDSDFRREADANAKRIIIFFGIVGIIWGYTEQTFAYTLYAVGVGVLLAVFLSLPPWPIYMSKSINWSEGQNYNVQKMKK